MLRIEPATPWQSPNKLGLCAWLKRSLQVLWFPLTSYIIHLTSLGCFLARRAGFFLLVGLKSQKRLMVWLGAFIWVLAHKEKNADITSETKSQPKQKGFCGFLSNPSEEE